MNRRSFLVGAGGVIVALPALEAWAPKVASAASPGRGKFAIILRQANGVAQFGQDSRDSGEKYFPDAVGPLTAASIPSDRALSEIGKYANKLLVVRGVNFKFGPNGCGHTGGGNQCLTAAQPSHDPKGNKSLAMGESIDNRIARELTPGVEPLTLYAGRKEGYINEVLSYRGPKMIRAAEGNPINAYKRLFNMPNTQGGADPKEALARKSVNDAVRSQLKTLQSRSDLSAADKQRLDLHFSSIRDLEVAMSCKMPSTELANLEKVSAEFMNGDRLVDIAKLQLDIAALAASCGMMKVATLQIGDGNDNTVYTVNGVRYPSYHFVSHRVESAGDTGPAIPGAVEMHHQIDRIHLRMFAHLLDKLSSYPSGSGTLLDQGVAMLTNDLAHGPAHDYNNVPYVLAGSAGGFLKQGQYVDAGGVNNNKILNTIGAALGCKNAAGGPLDDFGDPSLEKGLITKMLA
jgi:hypothetical protein